MIKFFRHIRKELMETGKSGKYLKYAIGEIILVVIGILIALQINNYNEERKQLNRGTELMSELQEELIFNIRGLKNPIQELHEYYNAKKKLLKHEHLKREKFNNISLDSVELLLFDPNVDVTPGQAMFEKIKSLGITKLTENTKLNSAIFDYFKSMQWIIPSVNYFFDAHKKRGDFLFNQQNSIAWIDELWSNPTNKSSEKLIEFMNQPRVINLIYESKNDVKASLRRLDDNRRAMIVLLELIQEELKKTNANLEKLPDRIYIEKPTLEFDEEVVGNYTGTYITKDNTKFDVVLNNGNIEVIIDHKKYELIPIAKNIFEVKHSTTMKFQFHESEKGEITGYTVTIVDDVFEATKSN